MSRPADGGGMDGRAEDRGRVYQTSGDQHIHEHQHHHYAAPAAPAPPSGSSAAAGLNVPDSVRHPAVGRPPVMLRDRAEVLDRLRAAVTGGRRGEAFVLHGMGGCGKTAVAHEAFRMAVGDGGRVGLWVEAADRAGLRAGMLAVAADRGAAHGELLAAHHGLRPAADLVWGYLDRSPEPWLLVLDSADEPEILRDGSWLRTSPRGTVIVTSRRAAARWWPGAELQHISVLPRADAARVLHDLAPHSGTLAQAAAIADRLGRLPLALTLAGGFLSQQTLDPWTMDIYGRQLDEGRGVELIDQGADTLSDDNPRHLVGRTWQLTLDSFAARGLPEATALLRLLARFAPEPLPLSVLNRPEIDGALPRARSETALRALLDQSLAELVEVAVRSVRCHGVLLESVAAATPPEEVPALDATALRLLDAEVPAVPDAGPDDPRLRLLVPHALALGRRVREPAGRSGALGVALRTAIALHRTGDYLSAWETARATAAHADDAFGGEHRLTLAAWSRTGRALFRLGRYDEAEPLLRRVHDAQRRLTGPEDPDTLDTAHGLQLVLRNLGRRDEAVGLLRSVAEGRRRTLGPAHPLTLRSRASLLTMLSAAELGAAPDRELLRLPAECVRSLGEEHTVTVGARHNHAYALYVLGRFEEADREIREVCEAYRRRFGPDYPNALAAEQLAARILAALGRRADAAEVLASVVARRERALGAGHPFTASSAELLAEYRSAG